MKRLLAVLGAVAMIGGAVLVRGALIGGDGDGGSGGNGSGGDGATHLICATELADTCAALAEEDGDITFVIEPAGDTAERLVDPAFRPDEADFDGWLTLQPWPALVELRRDLANQGAVLGETSDVLATAKLALVGPTERIDQLVAACGGEDETSWRCLGDLADDAWADHGGETSQGRIEVGHDDPTQEATGLLVLGQAASDYFGTTDFASNDFDADPGFRDWLEQLENADPGLPPAVAAQPVITQLEQFPNASWDAVGTLDPEAIATKARTSDAFTVLYPSPMIRAEVVLAPIRGHEVDLSDDDLDAALEDTGWTLGPAPQDAPVGPSVGVYEALIDEWKLAT